MIAAYTPRQQVMIVNNVVKAVDNIEQLTSTGYKFLMNCVGFIAHYNCGGFKAHYSDYDLRNDILKNVRNNQWNNFRAGEENYEYYMSRKAIYNAIVSMI